MAIRSVPAIAVLFGEVHRTLYARLRQRSKVCIPVSVEVLAILVCCWLIALVMSRRSPLSPFPGSLTDLLLLSFAAWHILPEVVFLTFGQELGRYRDQLQPGAIDEFGLLLALAVLLFAFGGAVVPARRAPGVWSAAPAQSSLGLGVWAVAFAALLAAGAGGVLAYDPSPDTYLVTGIAMTTYPLIAALGIADLAVLLRNPTFAIGVSALAMGTIGSRTSVALPACCAVVVMNRYGPRVSGRLLLASALLIACSLIAISAVRATGNRHEVDDDFDSRISKLSGAFADGFGMQEWHRVADDFGYRLDGNSFAALILQSQHSSPARPSIAFEVADTAWSTLTPAALSPLKELRALEERNEEARIVQLYNLPEDDYLPGPFSSAIALAGWPGACLLGLFAGVALGVVDRNWLSDSPVSLAIYSGACATVMTSSANVQGMIVQARSVVVFVALVWIIERVGAFFAFPRRPSAM